MEETTRDQMVSREGLAAPAAVVEPIRPGGVLGALSQLYDRLEARWEELVHHRTLGMVLVLTFLGSLAAIELNRQGLLPSPIARSLTTNHFGAVTVAFSLLLIVEILALTFALAHSVALSVGKQFELFSLILVRKAFLEVGELGEPVRWSSSAGVIPVVLADLIGALLIFVAVGFYYRIQRHRPITAGEREQASFVAAKKTVALALLLAFAALWAAHGWEHVSGRAAPEPFAAFYTVLIFSDILLVLISLSYSADYHVVFRNSGFAAATVMIRLALTAPAYVNVLLGVGAVLFAVALSLAYNTFAATYATDLSVRQEPPSR